MTPLPWCERQIRWLTPAMWGIAALIAVWRVHQALEPPVFDLDIYIHAIRTWYSGESVYEYVFPGSSYAFTYPPFAAVLLYPIGMLPITAVHTLWTLATVSVVVIIAMLIIQHRPPLLTHLPARLHLPVLIAALLLCDAVTTNLISGQISIFLAALLLLDFSPSLPRGVRGIATGVAAAIKLTPLAFIPALWLMGYRRAALTATLTALGCTLLAWILAPDESARYWMVELWDTTRIGDLGKPGNASITGALSRLGLDASMLRTLLWAVLATGVAIVGYWRVSRAAAAGQLLAACVITGALSVSVSPVSWKHHQLWLFLAVLLLSARPLWLWMWGGVLVAFTVVPVQLWRELTPALLAEPVVGNVPAVLSVAIAVAIPLAWLRGRDQGRGDVLPAQTARPDVVHNRA